MRMNGLVWIAVSSVALVAACSGDDENALAKEGESCSVSADCDSGLACREGVCVRSTTTSDAGNNSSMTDMGTNNTDPDMGGPIEESGFYVSYLLEDLNDDTLALHLVNTRTGEEREIDPEGDACQRGCWLTEDLSHFVFLRPNAGAQDVYIRPLDENFALGEETLVASGVSDVRGVGNFVTYSKTEATQRLAYFKELPTGTETQIGVIGTSDNNLGSWTIDPVSRQAVLLNATLNTLEVRVGELGSLLDGEAIYTVDASNFRDVGSFFSSSLPSAFSRDGKLLSVLVNAPLNYEACEGDSDCTGAGMICGRNDRCTAQQIAVLVFDLENADKLGEPCSGDAACGPIMTCDIPSDTQLDKATCIPRRVVLGLPGQLNQGNPPKPGCELTSGDLTSYTDTQAMLSYTSNNYIVMSASRDCSDFNIPKSDVLTIDPATGARTIVYGNPGADFDDALCYDEAEEAISIDQCVVYSAEAIASPAGTSIAFTATNPNVVEPNLADTTLDVWTVLRDGSEFEWVGKNSDFYNVTNLWVHEL